MSAEREERPGPPPEQSADPAQPGALPTSALERSSDAARAPLGSRLAPARANPEALGALLLAMEQALALRRMSPRTRKAYLHWVRRFLGFHAGVHPRDLGRQPITAFLSALAVRDRLSASTQNQALAALLFLYREVLGTDFP